MFKQSSMSLAVAICLSAGLGQAQAAEPLAQIKSLKGDALVTQGERFVSAREGMALQQLDRVVVLEQGGATIEFQDGCRHQMHEMELLTVGATSACQVKGAEYQAVEQTATSQISAKRKAGAVIGTGGAAGTAAGSAAGTAAGVAGTAAGTATGLGATIAGLGAATGLGVAGVVGVGALAVAGVAVAVNEATKDDGGTPPPAPISPE